MSDDPKRYGGARPKVRSERMRAMLDPPDFHRAPHTNIRPPTVRGDEQIIPGSTTRPNQQPLSLSQSQFVSRRGVVGPRREQSPTGKESSRKHQPECSPPSVYRRRTGRHSRADRQQKMQESSRVISEADLPFEALSLSDRTAPSTSTSGADSCKLISAPPQSTKIRNCDFCHREYVAITVGVSIEEEVPGSPSRVCDGCKYKPPRPFGESAEEIHPGLFIPRQMKKTGLEGKIVEEIPGWYLRVPSSPPKSLKKVPGPSPTVQKLIKKYPDLSTRGVPDYEDIYDEEEEEAVRKRLARPLRYQSSRHLESWRSWKSHLPADLAMSRHFKKNVLPPLQDCNQYNAEVLGSANRPCDVHTRGDPSCWFSWEFEDIPEQAYRRYWKQYRRADSLPPLDKLGRPKPEQKIMKFRNIYRPKKRYVYCWDKRMTTIRESRE